MNKKSDTNHAKKSNTSTFFSWPLCLLRIRSTLFVFWVIFSVFMITPIIIITRTYFVVHASTLPSNLASDTFPDTQTEGFTCGVHAIHAIYRAYGLETGEERIRWRLGVDTKAVFWMEDSTGALHPDIYMVLRQDGFDVRSIALGFETSHDEILSHLEAGQMVLMLIKRRENGNMHWVAAKDVDEDKYLVLDSLFKEPYWEGQDFTNGFLITALAVSPSGELKTGFWESLKHLSDGSAELAIFQERYSTLSTK